MNIHISHYIASKLMVMFFTLIAFKPEMVKANITTNQNIVAGSISMKDVYPSPNCTAAINVCNSYMLSVHKLISCLINSESMSCFSTSLRSN